MNQIGAKHETKRIQFTRKNLRKKRRKTHRSKTKNKTIINTKKRQRNEQKHVWQTGQKPKEKRPKGRRKSRKINKRKTRKKTKRNGNTHQPTDTYEIVPIVTYQLNGARPVKKYNQSNHSYRRKTAHSLWRDETHNAYTQLVVIKRIIRKTLKRRD